MSGESDGGKETSPRKGRREGTRGREGGVGEEKGVRRGSFREIEGSCRGNRGGEEEARVVVMKTPITE